MSVCECVSCECVSACVRVCVSACVRVCVCLVQCNVSVYVSCISVFEQADKISRNLALKQLLTHIESTYACTYARMNKWID